MSPLASQVVGARGWRRSAGVLLAILFSACVASFAQTPVPELGARVTDLTATFGVDEKQALEDELAALERRSGAQTVVLMISSLVPDDSPKAPDDIAQFATRVFERWKLGRKGVDDGVLLIVLKDDRKVRIEVGYGLEGTIPDVTAARIIREYIAPKFRDGDYYGGVQEATRVLGRLIEGEHLPEPLEGTRVAEITSFPQIPMRYMLLYVLFVTVFASLMLGFVLACTLRSLFNIFPVRVLPVTVRRACGLLAGPLIIVTFCAWTMHEKSGPSGVLLIAPALLGATVTARLGWSIAADGASQNWVGGLTWGELFSAVFMAAIGGMLSAAFGSLFGGTAGSSGSRGGFSGGGGRSGGGGASGTW